MIRIMLALMLIVSIWLVSCNTKRDSETLLNVYENFYSDSSNHKSNHSDSLHFFKNQYSVYLEYDTFDKLSRIEGFLLKKKYGHSFKMNTFDNLPPQNFSGKIIKYNFEVSDGSNFSYGLVYNFQTNQYEEIRTPFVDYIVHKSNYDNKDSLNKYSLFFSTFPRRKIEVSYSLNGNTFEKLDLKESKIMPFLEEGELWLSKRKKCIIKTNASGLIFNLPPLQNIRNYTDTICNADK